MTLPSRIADSTGWLAALFAALILSTRSLGYAVALLLLLTPLLVWRRAQPIGQAVRADLRVLWFASLALVGTLALAISVTGASWRALDYPSRLLLLPLLAWLLARLPFRRRLFWWGCAAGALGAASLAMYQALGGNARPGGYLNPIMFGNLALTLAVFSLVALSAGSRRAGWRGGVEMSLLGAGVLAGLATNLLAESRGGWLALLVMAGIWLVVAARGNAARSGPRMVAAVGGGVLVLAAAVWWLGTPQRYIDIYEHTARYLHEGVTAGTSEAERLEMWKHALLIWWESPWVGVGPGNLEATFAQLARDGLMDPHASKYSHAHNQFLDMLAGGGVVALSGFLATMLLPLWLLARRLPHAAVEARPFALAGIALIVLYLGFDLTQAMFAHNIGVIYFVVMLAICWRGALDDHRPANSLENADGV